MKTHYIQSIAILLCLAVFGMLPALAAGPFTVNGDGTVTDAATGLVWQQTDDGAERTWIDAGTYCTGLTLAGHSDWHLPEAGELSTLGDPDLFGPAIDTTAFPGARSSCYWSGSTDISNPSYAWNVYFNNGSVYRGSKDNTCYVRCVRGGSGSFDHLNHLIIAFSSSPAEVTTNVAATFSAAVSEGTPPYAFSIDFGDGSPAAQSQNVSHAYTAPGTYTATVTVTDSAGWSAAQSQTVTVTAPVNLPPTVSVTPSASKGNAPLTVNFNAQGTDPEGGILTFSWDFGDGTAVGAGIAVSHTFQQPGTYTVQVTAADTGGLSASQSQTITVTQPSSDGGQTISGIAHIEFTGLKDFYRVGETVAIELAETVHRDRFTRVDLWMVIKLPNGDIFFRTGLPLMAFSPTPQPHKTSIENTEASHRIFDFELPEGMGGDYTFYALYVEEGTNPLDDSFFVQRSNLAIQLTTFANRKVRNP
ncbi:MAG: DUF1566 domain-containing protein [Gammaproteobacteria bacterium]|nr:DUF1566 domain-containing protein [Gammaproteobacteria bacterium]